MKKKLITGVLLAGLSLATLAGCGESWERTKKNLESEYGGGLERVLTIYDANGNVIKRYEGKFDIESKSNQIKFINNGKVAIIYRSQFHSIIVEEK
jgi:hypothetical protein